MTSQHDHPEHDDPEYEAYEAHDHTLILDRLPPGHWHIDPDSSEVLFRARALFGLVPVTGVFERFAGEIRVAEDGAASGRLEVEMASIYTRMRRRDAILRSDAYFGADQHPRMTFTLERFEPSGEDHLNAIGSLEIRGRTVPLSLPVLAIAHGDHLHLEGGVKLDHDVAGLGWSKPLLVSRMIRAEVALTLNRD